MLFLITGQPGHRKTAHAIMLGLQYVKEGRDVYAQSELQPDGNWHGIRKLDYEMTGFKPLPDPEKWEELPDGSVILGDECYRWIPKRGPGKPIPAHIEALARHRHRGFDMILVCQKVDQLDSFMHGFVEQHTHVVKKMFHSSLRRFDRAVTNPFRDCGDVRPFRPPARIFQMYEPQSIDTHKTRVPMWIKYGAVLSLFIAFAFWAAMDYYGGAGESGKVADGADRRDATPATAGATAAPGKDSLRSTDYLAWMKPRVAGKPWTAPAYDGVGASSAPEVYCMSSAASCSCVTEQGTVYRMEFKLCRIIAREGNYNPTRRASPAAASSMAPGAGQSPAQTASLDEVRQRIEGLNAAPASDPFAQVDAPLQTGVLGDTLRPRR